MRTPRQDDPSISAWEALHRGAEREGIDSPARFELSRVATVVRLAPVGQQRPPTSDPVDQWRSPAPEAGGQRRRPASPTVTPQRPTTFDPVGQRRPPVSDPADQRRPPASPTVTQQGPEASDPVDRWRPPASPVVTQHHSRVRPYARTGGRTRSARDLALEALVSTSQKGCRYLDTGAAQHRAIRHLCMETRSIAEIAAYLSLPLGVVKVLVSDMADDGDLLIHQTGLAVGDRSSRDFMERVLQGLRAL
jgi:hypothetical protein